MRTIYLPIYTLRPFERGIQETLGKYSRFVMPGLGFQIPFIHVVRTRDVREHTMDIQPQAVITQDNVEIQVDGVMWVRPAIEEEAIKRTFYNIDNWKRAVQPAPGVRRSDPRREPGGPRKDRRQSTTGAEQFCRRMGIEHQQGGNPLD